jgi:HEXXH motif-containing protein
MHVAIPLLDPVVLSALVKEFRRSMRGLLVDLCDDLDAHYPDSLSRLGLPMEFFRLVGRSLRSIDYSNWKVVGWIEELNDLVYFLDVQHQLRRESGAGPAQDFVSALFTECEAQFYEHHYFDDLFPTGFPEQRGFRARLAGLCARMARSVTQEALFLVPGLPCDWLVQKHGRVWTMPGDLRPNAERAERGGCLYLGLDGEHLEPSPALREKLSRVGYHVRFLFLRQSAYVVLGDDRYALPLKAPNSETWWRARPPCWIRPPGANGEGGLTLGATLVYGRDRTPKHVSATRHGTRTRLQRTLALLDAAWPEGASLVGSLTSRIVPLDAPGVVSFSYRHRPGLSFINTVERDDLDLIDDVVHENSHHHLNVLLRKHRLYRAGHHEEIFYSPWRRSLRPLRGILHASFTFTIGALLFERLSSWWEGHAAGRRRNHCVESSLAFNQRDMQRDMVRARFRGLEEIASVRYSIRDLRVAADRLHWVTRAGRSLTTSLERHLQGPARRLARFRADVLQSRYGPALRSRLAQLAWARKTFGPLSAKKP